MIESPQLDTNEFEGLQNEQTLFNFESTLSETQNSENIPLPEGFRYDSDGYIVCETCPFTDEDYHNIPSPIDKILLGTIKEGEYRAIDYSNCDDANNSEKSYQNLLFLTCENSHIKEITNSVPIIIKEGMKIITPHSANGSILRYISYNLDDNLNNWKKYMKINKRTQLIESFNKYGITFSDINTFLGNDKTENDVFNILENALNDSIDEFSKKQIFGDYADKIEPISFISGIKWFKIKKRIGNTMFNEYLNIFINKLNRYNGNKNGLKTNFFNDELPDFLLSSSRPLTYDNLENYINCVNKGGHFDTFYTIEEQEILIYYNIDFGTIKNNNRKESTAKKYINKLKEYKKIGITKNIIATLFHDYSPNIYEIVEYIEDLFSLKEEGISLFYFLFRHPETKLQNLGGKEINEIPLNVNEINFCFRGILEMIKSKGGINVISYPGDDADLNKINEWENSRTIILKEYENLLRDYISLDFDITEKGEKIQKNRKKTFNKIFYSVAIKEEDESNAINKSIGNILDGFQSFSESKVENYASTVDNGGKLDQSNQKKLIIDVCNYANQHPNENILVFIGHHGDQDGSSGNGRTKEDRLKISKYPNVKIMSIRCYFGGAYNSENDESGDYIYDQLSQLSGFSNKTSTHNSIMKYLEEGFNKGLGFHELELYTRLKYGDIATPLTGSFEYTDQLTGESKQKIIGLAYEGEGDNFGNIS